MELNEPSGQGEVGAQSSPSVMVAADLPAVADVNLNNLAAITARLGDAGAHGYDPARFFMVQALIAKACADPKPNTISLQQKAFDTLVDFLDELHLVRQQVTSMATLLLEQYPQAETELCEAARIMDIRGLRRLKRRLHRRRGPGPLARLTDDLAELSHSGGLLQATEGFNDDLQAQEQEILSSYLQAGAPRAELRSAQRYRQAMLRVGAQQLVAQALAQSPADSGPLNPHRLAARSLVIMQNLSPAYTARFVSYIDTFFYLESLPADE